MENRIYKTANELSKILESRGIELDVDPVPIIQREGYYALINGYKEPFLDKKAMQGNAGDRYIPGTKFSHIYELFLFDRKLRETVLPFITRAEAAVRTSIVDSFCAKHQEVGSYLNPNNYVGEQWMLFPKHYRGNRHKAYTKGLSGLLNMFERMSNPSSNGPAYIRHYLIRYGNIPLWVLQNSMTFGNVKHFYQLLERDVQAHAARTIQNMSADENRLDPQTLLQVIEVLVDFRNICAHNDRLYCAKPRGRDFGELFRALRKVLPRNEIRELLLAINAALFAHPSLHGNKIILDVAEKMGAVLIPY